MIRKSQSSAGKVKLNRGIRNTVAAPSTDKEAYLPEQTRSGNILYRSTPPNTPETARNFTQFIFDHRNQRKVVPKASPRGGQFPGKVTMNGSGQAAAPFHPDKQLDT
jgi:hypothetical protein